eukprot:2568241-Alexandrium_andersonii.AAC.1
MPCARSAPGQQERLCYGQQARHRVGRQHQVGARRGVRRALAVASCAETPLASPLRLLVTSEPFRCPEA